jgi:hypothetical protein
MTNNSNNQSTGVNISSNTLFHFTNSLENLESILRDKFLPYYCFEDKIDRAIPMVCFCDLPLSQLKYHISVYGNYGIGLKKDWGILNKLNPVIYLSNDSVLDFQFMYMLNEFSPKLDVAINSINYIYGYLKPFKGDFEKNGIWHKDYPFYNEREWRYILSPGDMDEKIFLTRKEYEIKKQNKDIFIKDRLDFNAYDIKYLIIKSESEIHKIIEIIKRCGITQLDATEERLTTRIITSENIFDDV